MILTDANQMVEIPVEHLTLHENIRKDISDQELANLADSIKKNGILQPILVRSGEQEGFYEIIAGQRRFLAGQLAGLDRVPVYVKEIADSEIVEIQILENLQRADLTAIDESDAYVALMAEHQIGAVEVAAKVGKHINYVVSRLKLSTLIDPFKKMMKSGNMGIELGMYMGTFSEEAQKSMYKELVPKNFKGVLKISRHVFQRYLGFLEGANFDTSDPNLTSAGACTKCPFNSATYNSIFDEYSRPMCTKIHCYDNKIDVTLKRNLAKAKENPTNYIILYNDYDATEKDKKTVAGLKADGLQVIDKHSSDYRDMYIRKPDIEDYQPDEDDEMTEAGIAKYKKEYEKDLKEYHAKRKEAEEMVVKGTAKYALILNGGNKGLISFVSIVKAPKGTAKELKAKQDSGKVQKEDIEAEIQRIKDREKRMRELDAEKIEANIVEAIEANEQFKEISTIASEKELSLIASLIVDCMPYSARGIIQKGLGKTDLKTLIPEQFAFILRQHIVAKYGRMVKGPETEYFRTVAESLGIDIPGITAEQEAIAEQRLVKVKEKIAKLKELLKTEVVEKKKKA